jgi:regulator of sigma E protease
MQYLLTFLAIIVLIVVHEWGHYAVARWCKMKVEKFSIFFGPAIAKIKTKTTTFQIGTVPLGGFVQITGMNPMEDHDPKDPFIYPNRPAWQRFLTILAGPAMNYVAAVVIVFGIFVAWGIPIAKQRVASLIEKGPAAAAGIRPGDILVSIDGEPVDMDHPAGAILDARKGSAVVVQLLREGQPVEIRVTPQQRDGGHYLIGVQLMAVDPEFHRRGVLAAAKASLIFPIARTGDIIRSLAHLRASDVSGPIQITHQVGELLHRDPRGALVVIASLSIFLGLFNLLPLPALDGGRLAFLLYEIILRRRVNQRFEAGVHMVGIVVLLGVMVLVMFKDVRELFTAHGG